MNYNFTFEKNREVNRKVEQDLLTIKKELLNNLRDVSALILVGGFGRGEGRISDFSHSGLSSKKVMRNFKSEPIKTQLAKPKHYPDY